MFRIIRKSIFVSLLPLVVVAVVWGDTIRMQVQSAHARTELARFKSFMQDENRLDQTLRAHYVRLDENNQLTGTISLIDRDGTARGASGLEVNLVQKSEVITNTVTRSDGTFLTREVPGGSYTLCVAGDDGFLAYGIQVIDRVQDGIEGLPAPETGEEDAPAEPGESGANQSSASGGPANPHRLVPVAWTNQPIARQDEDSVELTAAVIPPEFSALQRIMSQYVPEGLSLSLGSSDGDRINVEESVVVGGFDVSLTPDGNLEGRIASLTDDPDEPIRLREMNAFLLQDDEIHSQVSVEENGTFLFNDIDPGVYGFVAAGPDGFAAMSFQAVVSEEADTSTSPDSAFRNASTKRRANKELQVAITPPEDLPWLRDKIDELNRPDPPLEPVVGQPVPELGFAPTGGQFGGGPGGGGGGPIGGSTGAGSGFAGFGDLIGAALAAWVISEAVGNNNNPVVTDPNPPLPPVIDPGPMSPSAVPFTNNQFGDGF